MVTVIKTECPTMPFYTILGSMFQCGMARDCPNACDFCACRVFALHLLEKEGFFGTKRGGSVLYLSLNEGGATTHHTLLRVEKPIR